MADAAYLYEDTISRSGTTASRSSSARALGPRGPRVRNLPNEPASPSSSSMVSGSSPRGSMHSFDSHASAMIPSSISMHQPAPAWTPAVTDLDQDAMESPILPRDEWDPRRHIPPPRPNTTPPVESTSMPAPRYNHSTPVPTPPPFMRPPVHAATLSHTPPPSQQYQPPKATPTPPPPAILKRPPQLNFEVPPISHKGLPLEAAQWTLSSEELQQIVSRAIRLSAQESYIRVLPVDTVDNVLTAEAERLANLRLTTQSQYRFQMHRRTMLLQSIVSCTTTRPVDHVAVGNLAVQISELTAQCDKLVEELSHIIDQQGQIKTIMELHWASALAIAVRKLNKSYERKSTELKETKVRVAGLEQEVKEAWTEAKRLAVEMDKLESSSVGEGSDWEGEVSFAQAQVVSVQGRSGASGTLVNTPQLEMNGNSHRSPFDDPTDRAEGPSTATFSRGGGSEVHTHRDQVAAAQERSLRTSEAGLRSPPETARRPPPLQDMPTQGIPKSMPSAVLIPDTPRPVPDTRTSINGFPLTRQTPSENLPPYRYSVPSEVSLSSDSYLEL